MKKLFIYLLFNCFILSSFAQSAITGIVINKATNEPLLGATVVVKNTNIGTVTGFDGDFTLNDVPNNAVLSVSFIGFKSVDISVNGQTNITVQLEEDIQSLDEVVLVGYGTQSKRDLTGSVGSVKAEELQAAPTPNFDRALAGRIAGVQVTSSDGTPGGQANIVIRGGNSITSDNSPLYVIDGVPLMDFDPASINTNDIESLDVLKDASATAIYGSRGANGVILINTKKGRSDGKTDIAFSVNSGVQFAPRRLEVLNPYQYVSYLKTQAYIADGYAAGNNTNAFLRTWVDPELYRNIKGTSWQDEIMRESTFQDYNLSVSGGGDATQFYYSGQLVNQDGIVINTKFNKTVNNIRVTHKVSERVKLDANLVYSLSSRDGVNVEGNGFSGIVIRDALVFRPVEPINDDGFDGFDPDEEAGRFLFNPVDNLNNTDRKDRRELLRGTISGKFDLSQALSLNTVGSFQVQNQRQHVFYGKNTFEGTRGNNGISGSIENSRVEISTGSAVLNYAPKLGRNNRLRLLGGIEAQTRTLEESTLGANQLPTDVFGIDNLNIGLVPLTPQTLASKSTLFSYFGRANYTLNKKYLFTLNFRADGSSKFRKENRWGYFPSFSLAWIASDESFLKDIDFLSNLKFRGGYGVTGNNRIGDFDSFTTLATNNSSGYVWGNGERYALGAIINNLGVPDLRWETTKQLNVGVDFALFKNKLQGEVDYYVKNTDDLLLNADMASSTGFIRVQQNVGEVQNRGIEVSLRSFNVSNKNFKWNTNFNIAFNRNEVLSLNQGQEAIYSDPQRINLGEFHYITKVGEPVGQIYGLQFDGLYQVDDFIWDNNTGTYTLKDGIPDNGGQPAPGSVKFKDLNNDGTINELDRDIIGNTTPDFIGGLTNTFNYKGWDLQVFFQFSYGSDVLNLNRVELSSPTGSRQNGFLALLDQWTPSNTDTNIHTYVYDRNFGRPINGTRISDLYVEDASFLRLKTISLGYTIPKKFMDSMPLESIRFFASAQNIATWTNYSGYDPEVSIPPRGGLSRTLTPNLDFSAYPQSVTITAGLKLIF